MKNEIRRSSSFSAYFICVLLLGYLPANIALAGSPIYDAQESGAHNNKLQLELTLLTDHGSYKLGDTLVVNVMLINKSNSPIYIFSPLEFGESASLSLWVKNKDTGRDVPQQFIADALPPPPTSKNEFTKLLPNYIYGTVLKVALPELNVKSIGAYELEAQYHSPIPSTMSKGLPIWSRERGTISSSQIVIHVVQ